MGAKHRCPLQALPGCQFLSVPRTPRAPAPKYIWRSSSEGHHEDSKEQLPERWKCRSHLEQGAKIEQTCMNNYEINTHIRSYSHIDVECIKQRSSTYASKLYGDAGPQMYRWHGEQESVLIQGGDFLIEIKPKFCQIHYLLSHLSHSSWMYFTNIHSHLHALG